MQAGGCGRPLYFLLNLAANLTLLPEIERTVFKRKKKETEHSPLWQKVTGSSDWEKKDHADHADPGWAAVRGAEVYSFSNPFQ